MSDYHQGEDDSHIPIFLIPSEICLWWFLIFSSVNACLSSRSSVVSLSNSTLLLTLESLEDLLSHRKNQINGHFKVAICSSGSDFRCLSLMSLSASSLEIHLLNACCWDGVTLDPLPLAPKPGFTVLNKSLNGVACTVWLALLWRESRKSYDLDCKGSDRCKKEMRW